MHRPTGHFGHQNTTHPRYDARTDPHRASSENPPIPTHDRKNPQIWLRFIRRRGSPFQGSAFRICRISRPRSAQEFCKFCRWRVLSLPSTCWEVDFSQRTNARDVGRRYMRFFCWISLATDGSKCNESHKFLNRKNPHQLPIRQNRIRPHFGQCRKNRSNCLYKGQ